MAATQIRETPRLRESLFLSEQTANQLPTIFEAFQGDNRRKQAEMIIEAQKYLSCQEWQYDEVYTSLYVLSLADRNEWSEDLAGAGKAAVGAVRLKVLLGIDLKATKHPKFYLDEFAVRDLMSARNVILKLSPLDLGVQNVEFGCIIMNFYHVAGASTVLRDSGTVRERLADYFSPRNPEWAETMGRFSIIQTDVSL